MVMHRRPNPIERAARQAAVWSVISSIHFTMGPLPEFRQAQQRVAAVPTAPCRRPRHRPMSRGLTRSARAPRPSRWPDRPRSGGGLVRLGGRKSLCGLLDVIAVLLDVRCF